MRIVEQVIDLSLPFHEGMPTDDLGPKIWERISYSYSRRMYQDKQSRSAKVILTTDHTGTHIDGPLRFDPRGASIEKIELNQFIRPARSLDLRSFGRRGRVDAAALKASGAAAAIVGDAIVLWTGHDRFLEDPDYFWNRPELTEDGAEYLASLRPGIVAADFPGIGRPGDDRFVVKRILHRAGCMTLEQLRNLDATAGKTWHLFCGPLPVRGLAGSMVRACALVGWRASRTVDLTHEHFIGMPSVGPQPVYWLRASHPQTLFHYDGKLSYQTHALFMSEHAGTHFDVPYHFKESGRTISDYDLNELFVVTKMFDMTHKKPLEGIGAKDFAVAAKRRNIVVDPGDGVIVWTGHSENYHLRKDFGSHRPFITADGAQWLLQHKASMVITDLVGLDEPKDMTMPIHNALLHGDVCMLQVATNLHELVDGDWFVGAFPINFVEGTAAPLRAFAARL